MVDVSTIKVYANGQILAINPAAAVSNQDRTTVTAGQVRLEKLQALDTACNGTIVGTFVTSALQAKPGECIVYQIKAYNDGKAEVSNVNITDTVPAYTVAKTPTVETPVIFAPISKESVKYKLNGKNLEVGSFKLQPNQNATLQFSVEVNQ